MKTEKTKSIRLSKWVHIFERKDMDFIAVYHSLKIQVIFLELKFKKMIEFLKFGTTLEHLISIYSLPDHQGITQTVEALSSSGLVVDFSYDDMSELETARDEYVRKVGIETLYLIVTDSCNLRCGYCFLLKNMPTSFVKKTMSWEMAQEAVDMFFSNLKRNPSVYKDLIKCIVFYGGEPLLNFPLIKRVVEYVHGRYSIEVKELGDNFIFSIITNGTSITKEIAEFVRNHPEISIAVSLDGPKEVHDQFRFDSKGKGSFDQAIKGCELLRDVGKRTNVTVSCTLGKHNIDNLSSLLKLRQKYGFLAVNLNFPLDTEDGLISREEMLDMSKRVLDYFEKARADGCYEDRTMRKVRCFVEQRIHPFDCQATGSQIVCSADGKLGLCHEGLGYGTTFFGPVSKDFDFHNHSLVREWKRRTPLNMPQCFDCPALGICGGGCALGAQKRNGTIWSIDDRFCPHSLLTLEWAIWDLCKSC